MFPLKKMTISGFRGINAKLDIDFSQNKNIKSMVIYGKNGTGKSSITDAWEWLYSGKIEHLRREGAGPAIYPHRLAAKNESFVEIETSNKSIGTIRQAYDNNRVTVPIVSGEIDQFRKDIPYPCHIRFGDLTRFVYFQKAQRFDVLAELMGFVPQVEYQKSLKKVHGKLEDDIERYESIVNDKIETLAKRLNVEAVDEYVIISSVVKRFKSINWACKDDLKSVHECIVKLKKQVAEYPEAKELSDIKDLKEALMRTLFPTNFSVKLTELLKAIRPLKAEEKFLSDLFLMDLYKAGEKVLEATEPDKRNICPLCGHDYEGDLLAHVQSHYKKLEKLHNLYKEAERQRKLLNSETAVFSSIKKRLEQFTVRYKVDKYKITWDEIISKSQKLEEIIGRVNSIIEKDCRRISNDEIKLLSEDSGSYEKSVSEFEEEKKKILNRLIARIEYLEKDESRAKMVDVHTFVVRTMEDWEELIPQKKELANLRRIIKKYSAIIDEYIHTSTKEVEKRFEKISKKVESYFGIIEKYTPGIGKPALKLLPDQERSVIMEVEFQGESISPAYKYLSESQLNSFGLAVFLASVREFNQDFQFVILDDVINSFDSYKRPQVINLLKNEFKDWQVLLLTHDRFWRDQIYRSCGGWVKKEFYNFAYSVGPLIREGSTTIEEIDDLIAKEKIEFVGGSLGAYMEQKLQVMSEYFEVLMCKSQGPPVQFLPLRLVF